MAALTTKRSTYEIYDGLLDEFAATGRAAALETKLRDLGRCYHTLGGHPLDERQRGGVRDVLRIHLDKKESCMWMGEMDLEVVRRRAGRFLIFAFNAHWSSASLTE